jgi:hypothetical protein
MSYRPITDFWFLARAKLKSGRKYYGAYLGGFPERARVLVGAGINEPVLHACGGMARHYPYALGFGPADKTMDIDPSCEPDYLQDAREPWRVEPIFKAVIIDPPYSEADAAKYAAGVVAYPSPYKLLVNAFEVVPHGGRVGILHYMLPKCPKDARFIACVAVACGFNNRLRAYSVFEKL